MKLTECEIEWLEGKGAEMMRTLGVKEGDVLMDFGCGEGRYSTPMSQVAGKQGCVYSVERDKDVIVQLKRRLEQYSNLDNVTILNTEDLHVSEIIGEASIDFIIVFDVLQYVENKDELFAYFSRVLKPEGMIAVYPAAVPHPGAVDMDLVIDLMKKHRLSLVREQRFHMMHNVFMEDDLVYCFCREE